MNKIPQVGAIASFLHDDKEGSIALYWSCVRKLIFRELESRKMQFSSTEGALVAFFGIKKYSAIFSEIYKLYHYYIIMEYAPSSDTEACTDRYIEISRSILRHFGAEITENALDSMSIKNQLDGYIDDASSSAGSHFIAAERYEIFVKIVAFGLLTTTSIGAILSVKAANDAFANSWFGFVLPLMALLSAGLSALNAANDWKTRLEKHRLAANKYISIKRDALFLKTELSLNSFDDTTRGLYFEKLANIKNVINSITQDAPQIPDWAYRKYKKTLSES